MITIGGKENGTPESPRLPSEAEIALEIRESALCFLTLPL